MKINYPGSLHNHTDFSNFRLRDSINTVETLIDRAIKLGHSVVAITEHETVASSIRAEKYYDKIKSDNPDFKLVRGNEIYLCRNGLNAQNFNKEQDRYYHFILLAKDAIGHEQIREISTRAWSHSYTSRKMMRVPTYYQDLFDVIGSNPGHVIGSTACLGGFFASKILQIESEEDKENLVKWLNNMVKIFGKDDFYLEMQPSDQEEQKIVNQAIVQFANELDLKYIGVISGPSIAKEVINDMELKVVFASNNSDYNNEIKNNFETDKFKIELSDDVIGTELGGTLKNIISIASGLVNGLNLGNNMNAILITKGLEEIKEIGLKLGAKEETFYGLSSLGDLLTTCLSNESRNNRCGTLLSQGKKIDEIKEEIGMVIEGLDALKIAHDISQKYNIDTKIINTLYDIIYNEKSKESIIDVILK